MALDGTECIVFSIALLAYVLIGQIFTKPESSRACLMLHSSSPTYTLES